MNSWPTHPGFLDHPADGLVIGREVGLNNRVAPDIEQSVFNHLPGGSEVAGEGGDEDIRLWVDIDFWRRLYNGPSREVKAKSLSPIIASTWQRAEDPIRSHADLKRSA